MLSGPAGISAVTFGGTVPDPKRRLAAAIELAGSVLVLGGSAVLVAVAGVSALAIVAVVGGAATIIYGAMAYFLHAHMALVAKEGNDPPGTSWRWCLMHPRWRPPPD